MNNHFRQNGHHFRMEYIRLLNLRLTSIVLTVFFLFLQMLPVYASDLNGNEQNLLELLDIGNALNLAESVEEARKKVEQQ